MNKTAIKNYAIWARIQLIKSAKQRAFEYEITDGGENQSTVETVGGRLLSKEEKEQRRQLIEQIRQKGYNQVMEEAAYTWFNRFIALRFMEVNGYLPSKIRVFTDENGAFKPEILKQAMSVDLEGLDRNRVLDLLDKQDNEELFKYLLIAQCNALNAGLPYMFEKIANWTELLFPANLLRQDSVIGQMISEIPEGDWTDAVQIIGWLYQYYNTEKFDSIYDGNMSKNKVSKEMLPSATQLFTPDWIVRYMVENSLGRLWCEGHPDFDKSQWKYYMVEAEQDSVIESQLQKIRAEYAAIKPEEIKVIDPCMGSGHILVYAFDVLMQIYTSAGWSERDAAKSILENNLYGLDIDDRAGQLAYFAVMMKARKHSRRILNGEVKPNVISIQDSNWMTDEFIAYVAGKDMAMKADLVMLRKTFKDAKEYGSILNVPAMRYAALYERIDVIRRSYAENLFEAQYQAQAVDQLLPLVKQSQIMSQKYDVAVTNPPYLGTTRFSTKLAQYINSSFPDEKTDLAMVILRKMSTDYTKSNAYIAGITTASWMYLKSFEKFRLKSLSELSFINIIDLGTELFDGKIGHLPIVSWVQQKHFVDRKLTIVRLVDYCYSRRDEKIPQFYNPANRKSFLQSNFIKIPGSPISYWLTDGMVKAFEGLKLSDYGMAQKGLDTCDVERFVRYWQEVEINKIGFRAVSNRDTFTNKWFPYAKGGEYRKWAGNNYFVVLWENNGAELRNFRDEKGRLKSRPQNTEDYFKPLVTWSAISSSPSMRLINNSIYGGGGTAYLPKISINYCLAFLNTKIALMYLKAFSPTINYEAGHVMHIPLIFSKEHQTIVESLTSKCVSISQEDWNSFETSWEFKKHPLI